LGEERVNLVIVKFAAIATLDGKNGMVEWSTGIDMIGCECNKNIKFLAKRNGPKITCIIIHNNKVIAKTRGTRYR
jgi:hypothetical protein